MAMGAIVWLLFAKTKRKKLLENTPSFVAPKGEFNHATDLIPPADSPRAGGETDDLNGLNDASTASDDDDEDDKLDDSNKLDVV